MRFQHSQRSLQLTPNALNQLKLVVQAHRTPQALSLTHLFEREKSKQMGPFWEKKRKRDRWTK
jgi:hypothetical protein